MCIRDRGQGINDLLTQDGILLGVTTFTHVSVFQNEDLTCLLFPFEDVKLDIGKLAMWLSLIHIWLFLVRRDAILHKQKSTPYLTSR